MGWRSLRRALASIWRIRSLVTVKSLPTSSNVWSDFAPMPKRDRHILDQVLKAAALSSMMVRAGLMVRSTPASR